MKSKRNKTIDFPLENAGEYLDSVKREECEQEILPCATVLGDAFNALKKIKDKSVDLLIVDPPYNLDKDFHGNGFKKLNAKKYEEYTRAWIDGIYPKLKETASVYVCCDWKSALIIGGVMDEKFILRNRITWQREKGRGAKANWKNGMEDIFFATVSENYTFNLDAVKQRKKVLAPYRENGKPKDWEDTENGKFRNTCPSNFWDDIAIPYWSMAENTAHPTQKPEKLLAKLILASSNPGDFVFDPFLGSGSTAVTARKLNRHYGGVEINPQYCVWAEKRLENALKESSIQGFTDGVFWERNTSAFQNSKKKVSS
jgi:site-specific DNA-methyltransferase (adenine-specific)